MLEATRWRTFMTVYIVNPLAMGPTLGSDGGVNMPLKEEIKFNNSIPYIQVAKYKWVYPFSLFGNTILLYYFLDITLTVVLFFFTYLFKYESLHRTFEMENVFHPPNFDLFCFWIFGSTYKGNTTTHWWHEVLPEHAKFSATTERQYTSDLR